MDNRFSTWNKARVEPNAASGTGTSKIPNPMRSRPPKVAPQKPVPNASKTKGPRSSYEDAAKAEFERNARLKARSIAMMKKLEELRIRNFVDHYFNLAMLNAKLNQLLFQEELLARKKEPKGSSDKYVFYSVEKEGLPYRSLKRETNDEPFRVEIDVKGCNPKNVHIDSQNNRICVKATSFTGRVRTLNIICPTTEDVDRITINLKNGVLLLEGPTTNE